MAGLLEQLRTRRAQPRLGVRDLDLHELSRRGQARYLGGRIGTRPRCKPSWSLQDREMDEVSACLSRGSSRSSPFAEPSSYGLGAIGTSRCSAM
jgi:hypothetical protein